jgi:hypothetical protein
MRPENNNRSAITNGSQASTSFGISVKDEAHLMGILREGLYTDRILAVLREYSANAWDAHRAVGKHELPIEVHIPVEDDPVLRIRDHGAGLSHDEMFQIFTQYGSSTKRDSDDVVGMLGIGSKSGFAYADTFTVISRHGGMQRTYVAALDESEKGTLSLLDERECEGTGLEIQVTSKPDDFYAWEKRAKRLYKHFEPRPTINIELPEPPPEAMRLEGGMISSTIGGSWKAIMGCVPYCINLGQLDEAKLPKCLREMSGRLHFKIGDVAISASREELKYTTKTKELLVERFTALVDEYVTTTLNALEAQTISDWNKRLAVRVLAKLGIPLPEQWKDYAQTYVQISYDEQAGFFILHNNAVTTRITIDRDTTIWVDDVSRDLKGYDFVVDDYVVRSKTLDPVALRAALDAALAASKLTGVAINTLSNKSWAEWRVPKKKVANPKHRARMFQLVCWDYKVERASDRWEVVTRVPDATDVYVTIEAFLPIDAGGSFWRTYKHVKEICELIAEPFPEVYGYKTSTAKPLDKSKLVGQSWEDWHKAFVASLKTQYGHMLEYHHWLSPKDGYSYSSTYRFIENAAPTRAATVERQLGVSHPLAKLMRKASDIQKLARPSREALSYLREQGIGPHWGGSECKREVDAVTDAYPLLVHGIDCIGKSNDSATAWIEYIQLIDAREQLRSMPVPGQGAQLKVV